MKIIIEISIFYFVVFSFLFFSEITGKNVTISNISPRLDSNGNIMDAHDGDIIRYSADGPYFFYAMSYGTCKEQPTGCYNATLGACGFRLDHNISVWTSPDLSSGSWVFQGYALPVDQRPVGIYYRPKVLYNPNTKLYVLWVNWLKGGNFGGSQYLVATSQDPIGPFKVVNSNVATRYTIGGDFSIMVDNDSEHSAYFIYTSLSHAHSISIEKLSSDYLSSLAATNISYSSGIFGASNCEAPALFERESIYYALFDHCCCFCEEGSGIVVYTATSPLGPYVSRGQIGLDNQGNPITHAQQNYVMKIATPQGSEFIWTGDRWQSSASKIKAYDFQYWSPLVFTNGPTKIQHLTWLDSFTIRVI